ncbi:MAG TPA: hypothetical protein VGL15_10965 [Vicinamibacteria bacterium]|jgi:hypothetical protein
MLRKLIMGLLIAGLAASPAGADKGGKGKGKGKGKEKGEGADVVVVKEKNKEKGKGADIVVVKEKDKEKVVVFTDRDRDTVRTYWTEAYRRGDCPPGLAKKHNGCMPPGQAKKRYVIGQRLPATVVVQPVPQVLVTRLGPVPAGYRYVMVDGDVLKLAVGTRLVVDAIHAIVQ